MYRVKVDIINEIMRKVAAVHSIQTGTAAEQDEQRRQRQMAGYWAVVVKFCTQ